MDPSVALMRLGDLEPWGGNPRKISDEARAGLAASLKEFGLVQPIVFNRRSNRIVGGHQRHAVLLETHGPEHGVHVVVVDLDESREIALNVTLNNPEIGGEFTDELDALLESIQEHHPELFDDLGLGDLATPDFGFGDLKEQGGLDKKKKIECPECGHEFRP